MYNGQEWTARSTEDSIAIEAGETVYVEAVRGVSGGKVLAGLTKRETVYVEAVRGVRRFVKRKKEI